MEKPLFLQDVLKAMDMKDENGYAVPFDIAVREFSAQNKTGGKYRVYNDARLLIAKPKTAPGEKDPALLLLRPEKARKNPNHFVNSSRNIELPNGEIKKINIRFIIKFNNQNVVY